MLLTIDVGNTETKFGVFDGDELFRTWRIQTDARRTPDEFAALFAQLMTIGKIGAYAMTKVVVSSVVPQNSTGISCSRAARTSVAT